MATNNVIGGRKLKWRSPLVQAVPSLSLQRKPFIVLNAPVFTS
ncbi:hypothetical protein [Scytonema sp. UIC 10036]|nr:hypothetical protein [Scytonema sp. UIC 10036]